MAEAKIRYNARYNEENIECYYCEKDSHEYVGEVVDLTGTWGMPIRDICKGCLRTINSEYIDIFPDE